MQRPSGTAGQERRAAEGGRGRRHRERSRRAAETSRSQGQYSELRTVVDWAMDWVTAEAAEQDEEKFFRRPPYSASGFFPSPRAFESLR